MGIKKEEEKKEIVIKVFKEDSPVRIIWLEPDGRKFSEEVIYCWVENAE